MKLKNFFIAAFVGFIGISPIRSAEVVLPTGVQEDRLAVDVMWQAFHRLPGSQRPKVTLVLGGGGAHGLSHIGVIRVLEQERIPIDRIVGVSVGALIGGLYAAGIPIDEIEGMASDVGWDELTDFSRLNLMKLILSEELMSTERMETYLRGHIGDIFFKDLRIPFSCIATNIETGEQVIFREGPVAMAARASSTVPGLFKPVVFRNQSLVDGGIINNLPTNVALDEDPMAFILAVKPKGEVIHGDIDNVVKTLVRSIEIQRDVIVDEKQKYADFLITPMVKNISVVDLNRSEEAISAGTKATRKSIIALKRKILSRVAQGLDVSMGEPK